MTQATNPSFENSHSEGRGDPINIMRSWGQAALSFQRDYRAQVRQYYEVLNNAWGNAVLRSNEAIDQYSEFAMDFWMGDDAVEKQTLAWSTYSQQIIDIQTEYNQTLRTAYEKLRQDLQCLQANADKEAERLTKEYLGP